MGLGKRVLKFLFDDTRFEQHEPTPPLQGSGGALMGPRGAVLEDVLERQMNPTYTTPDNEPGDEKP